MARRTMASSGGSSHNGGGKPSRMGGMMGVRKSFFQQYFSSMRSVTHAGTGIGTRKSPCGLQPTAGTSARAAPAISIQVRNLPIRLILSFPEPQSNEGATARPHPGRRPSGFASIAEISDTGWDDFNGLSVRTGFTAASRSDELDGLRNDTHRLRLSRPRESSHR